MKMLLPTLLCVPLLLSACGSDPSDIAKDTSDAGGAPATPAEPQLPTEVPAADGPVHTGGLVTVMDTGSPEVCLGAVAESYPPQCGGPALLGWDWAAHPMHEKQGEVTWGSFHLIGTWDGEAFTVTEAVPAALYDQMVPEPSSPPAPEREYADAELQAMAEDLGQRLPGAQGAYSAEGHVLVDVIYDDGSIQAWADEVYGANVVIVHSVLRDA